MIKYSGQGLSLAPYEVNRVNGQQMKLAKRGWTVDCPVTGRNLPPLRCREEVNLINHCDVEIVSIISGV
ncbi:hypothetical protein [Bartonella sp. AD328YNZD]|uniref:hypothetical protein n=1 Tax=Bartonella sp. AD328YNZD TaxID=3243464 RepID=UPI0035CFCBB3